MLNGKYLMAGKRLAGIVNDTGGELSKNRARYIPSPILFFVKLDNFNYISYK